MDRSSEAPPLTRVWPLPTVESVDSELLTQWLSDRSLVGTSPRVRMNFVASIDGSAGNEGDSEALSSSADKLVFEILRRVCDVVVVGAGTVRAEGYGPMRVSADSSRWRVANGLPPHPVFAIPTARADLDPAHRIFTEAPVRPMVFTVESAPQPRRTALAAVADVVLCGVDVLDPKLMLKALLDRGLAEILSEGGPALHGSMLAAGIVDEMFLTVSPVLEGGGGLGRIAAGAPPAASQAMTLVSVMAAGDFLLLRYRR